MNPPAVRSAAIVPVKRASESKSRLANALGRERCEALCLAMLGDVLEALAHSPCVVRRVVVTPDETVAAVARDAGAEALHYAQPGLNAAIDFATTHVAADGASDASLVILGDIAAAAADDLDAMHAMLGTLGGHGAVIAGASDGGTAALLRAPHASVEACFGKASGARHRVAAQRAGVPHATLHLASLALDLDDEHDLARFLRRPGGGRRTATLLADADEAGGERAAMP